MKVKARTGKNSFFILPTSSFILHFKPRPRVDLVEGEKAVEKVGVELRQLLRLLKEAFRAVGEQFGAILGGFFMEKCFLPRREVATQVCQLAVEGADPPLAVCFTSKWRRASYIAVEPIEMVGKFMQHDVFAIGRVAAAVKRIVPREANLALLKDLSFDRDVFF